jgi:CelD/BcsL family acetyltransferase involved in cellulose biosynthesis
MLLNLPCPSPVLTVREISTGAALAALRSEWTDLFERCPSATVFQSPEWLLGWWRHFGSAPLWVLALRQDDRLAGLAPFYVYRNTVVLLGNGVSDYLDVLVEPGLESAGASAVLAHLDAQRERWEQCDFRQLRPNSPLAMVPAPADWSEYLASDDPCMSATLADFPGALSPHFLKKLDYEARYLGRLGTVTWEQASPENFTELFDAFRRLHAARWSLRREPDLLADETVAAFHAETARQLLARGMLRLHALRQGERIVACCYGFAHRGRISFYAGGFDPDFARHGIGNLSVFHAMNAAVREGAETFDFLRGCEPYKARWGARESPTLRRCLAHPGAGADIRKDAPA